MGPHPDGRARRRAAIIASQAVITGAFSVTRQAMQLGYIPRMQIMHTSHSTIGQIYIPWINRVLMVAVITVVLLFRSATGWPPRTACRCRERC